MSTYKLIQDIEAEDHILGPLSLKQFIYALATAFCGYICFIGFAKHIIILLIMFLPPMLMFAFFAFPFRKDQPTEVWAIAKIRFLFKPRRRIWDQTGIKELVTINVPKKIERVLTDGLNETEVRSRLQALASTIDSRGWAIKHVEVYGAQAASMNSTSDRLIDVGNIPQEVPNYEVRASDDILDETNNPIARQFDQMITTSTQTHRQDILERMKNTVPEPMNNAQTPANYWFANQSASGNPPSQDEAAQEAALSSQLHARADTPGVANGNMRTLQPIDSNPSNGAQTTDDGQLTAENSQQTTPAPAVPLKASPDATILSLANNNDLNVATLARQASKAKNNGPQDDEVVISLH